MLISRQTTDPSGTPYLKIGEGWLRGMEQAGLNIASRNGVIDGFLVQAKKLNDQGKVRVLAPSVLVAVGHIDSTGGASAYLGLVPPVGQVKALVDAGGVGSVVNRVGEVAMAGDTKPIWAWAAAIPRPVMIDAVSSTVLEPTYARRDDTVVNGSFYNMNYYNPVPTAAPGDPGYPGFAIRIDAYPELEPTKTFVAVLP